MGSSDTIDAFVIWCLSLGPSARYLLPLTAGVVGLAGIALVVTLLARRSAWRARELLAAARTTLHANDAGARVSLVGRLRVPGQRTVASFSRAGRDVAVSALQERLGPRIEWVATRSAEGLAIETREGLVPLAGSISVRRARGGPPAENVEERTLARRLGATELHANDLVEGEWVLAEGVVVHATREALREQGAVRGLASSRAPLVLTAILPDVSRWTVGLAAVAALALALVASLLLWPTPPVLPVTLEPLQGVWAGIGLLGPARRATLELVSDSVVYPTQRLAFAMAQAELGNCGVAVATFASLRRDEEALAVLEQAACTIDPALRLQVRPLLEQSGDQEGALSARDRQCRVLGILSAPHGARAESGCTEPRRSDVVPSPGGCHPDGPGPVHYESWPDDLPGWPSQ